MFTEQDIRQIRERGAEPGQIEQQVEHFKKGFPWMKIAGPATPQRGIRVLSADAAEAAAAYYRGAAIHGKCKFVPASGAVTRVSGAAA